MKKRIAYSTLLACVLVYVSWIIWPHVMPVKVYGDAHLSSVDENEVIKYLQGIGAFHGRGDSHKIIYSFFAPSTRPSYFVEILGTPESIYVSAGSPTTGGRTITGKKIGGAWVFNEEGHMLWKH